MKFKVLGTTLTGPNQWSVHEAYKDGTYSDCLCICELCEDAHLIADALNLKENK